MARMSVFLAIGLLLQVSALRIEQKTVLKNKKSAPKLTDLTEKEEMEIQQLGDQMDEKITGEVNVTKQCIPDRQMQFGKKKECVDSWYKTKQCKNSYQMPGYRLGDMYRIRGGQDNRARLQPYIKYYFPESIGAKYVEQHKHARDAKTLLSIIDGPEYKDFEKPAADTLVVHFRLGDILHFADKFEVAKKHLKDESWYAPKVEAAKQKGLKKAVLITGDHQLQQMASLDEKHAQDARESTQEVNAAMKKFAALFEKAGMKVTTRINYNADCDLVYMSNAKYFAPGAGQFTQTIKEMVQLKGGEVL
jgi:hypothetical protein